MAKRLVIHRNRRQKDKLQFFDGFPVVVGGNTPIKNKCAGFLQMATAGIHVFAITDLDTYMCASALIRDWFGIPCDGSISLPTQVVFRVAVREIESWVIADRISWARYIGIASANFAASPDTLPDPKQHVLDVLRRKGTKKRHREMLPRGTAHIGPLYNEVICDFIKNHWSPNRAAASSPSLKRAIDALNNF